MQGISLFSSGKSFVVAQLREQTQMLSGGVGVDIYASLPTPYITRYIRIFASNENEGAREIKPSE